MASTALIAPWTCAALPVKSMVIVAGCCFLLYAGFSGGCGRDLDGHGYAHGVVFHTVVIKEVLGLVAAGRDGAQEGSHHFFGINEQIVGGLFGAGDSVAG